MASFKLKDRQTGKVYTNLQGSRTIMRGLSKILSHSTGKQFSVVKVDAANRVIGR